jgi:hypothetical protein
MHHRDTRALVPRSSRLPGQGANRPSQPQPEEQDPITHASEITTNWSQCREHRLFYPDLNYEVVQVTVTIRNSPPDIFHILRFPIDQLDDHLTAKAIRLYNLRSIAFCDPLSWPVFMTDYAIMDRVLRILTNVPSLTKVTIGADILNDRILQTLSEKLYLQEVEILFPSVPFPFPNRLASIEDVLNRGIGQLSQVEYFKIPLDLITNPVLSSLARLPRLHSLKTTGSFNAPYPARYFIACMGYLRQNPEIFGNLQLLDIRHNSPQEDFFAKDTLTKIFPNTRFIHV